MGCKDVGKDVVEGEHLSADIESVCGQQFGCFNNAASDGCLKTTSCVFCPTPYVL